ncbi:MAG: MFS transporter [Planctomycetota bacterium]
MALQRWERTYWVVFAANLVTAVGMMSFLPFFPSLMEELGVQERGAIAAWSGVVFGAAPFTAALMGPVWGSIGDRIGRKLMVLRALLAISLFVGAMGFARSPWELLLLRIGQGIFAGFVPPSITLVSIAAPRAVQGRITGSLQASLWVGSIAGPLLGAFVRDAWGLRAVFFLVAALSGLGAFLIGLFAHEEEGLRATLEAWSPGALLGDVVRDLKELLRLPRVRTAVVLLFLLQFGVGSTNPLLEIFVGDVWTGDPRAVPGLTAWLFTAFAGAGLVASPLWGRWGDRVGHHQALLLATALAGLALLGHAAAATFAVLLAARIGIGVTAGGANACSFGLAATSTSAERRGSGFGAVFSARALALSLGAMSGGALSSLLGIPGLFLAAGVVVLGAILGLRPWR